MEGKWGDFSLGDCSLDIFGEIKVNESGLSTLVDISKVLLLSGILKIYYLQTDNKSADFVFCYKFWLGQL